MGLLGTIEDLIARAPVFAGLSEGQLGVIAGCGRNDRSGSGAFLFREGDSADRFWLIRSGSVALEVHAPGVVSCGSRLLSMS